MADFWGIDKINEKYDDGKGCSLVIAHTPKGTNYIQNCNNSKIFEVNIIEAVREQANAFNASQENPLSYSFWSDYFDRGFYYVLKKYFNYTLKGKVKAGIKRVLFQFHIRYLY